MSTRPSLLPHVPLTGSKWIEAFPSYAKFTLINDVIDNIGARVVDTSPAQWAAHAKPATLELIGLSLAESMSK